VDELRYIQRLVDSNFRLAAIETRDKARIIGLFRALSRATGKAVYCWSAEEGLYRLDAEHVSIPQTRRLAGALDYIESSIHYGIYLLPGINAPLRQPEITNAVRRAATGSDRVQRLVVMVDKALELPTALAPVTARLRHGMKRAG
jgi:hypothetical protein